MSEICFTVNPESRLYKEYFGWLDDRTKIYEAFDKMQKLFGIETDEFYVSKETFKIVPSRLDHDKFENDLKKTSYGEFKKNTAVHKKWLELTGNIKHFHRPRVFCYFNGLRHWQEWLFHDGNVLYGKIQTSYDGTTILNPEIIHQIKASEYYTAMEKLDEEKVN